MLRFADPSLHWGTGPEADASTRAPRQTAYVKYSKYFPDSTARHVWTGTLGASGYLALKARYPD